LIRRGGIGLCERGQQDVVVAPPISGVYSTNPESNLLASTTTNNIGTVEGFTGQPLIPPNRPTKKIKKLPKYLKKL
jgi:hypothetical protein